jgi:chromate reductase
VPRILIVNGSLGGSTGNTAELLALAEERLTKEVEVSYLELIREPKMDRILDAVKAADGFIFGTGTYWDSWGSPMQRFLEMTAHTEGEPIWVGKPVGVIVTAHAVGAKSVLSRLIGVCNVYGMLIPPFAGIAYTYANQVALEHANDHLRNELWSSADVDVVCHNVLEALRGGRDWTQWPTNSGRYGEKWLYAYSQDSTPPK